MSETDVAMTATAPEDDDPRQHAGELVPDSELQFTEDTTLLASDLLLDDDDEEPGA